MTEKSEIKRTRDLEIELFDHWYKGFGDPEIWGEDHIPITSPIEKIFWLNLMKAKFEDFPHWLNEVHLVSADYQFPLDKKTGKYFYPHQGYPTEYYIIDFVLHYIDFARPKNHAIIAVELDGHDFHEKTKSQAKKDKQKDRWLQSNGFIVARFTGSEVWNDPQEVVIQAERLAYGRLRDMARATG